MKFKVSSDKTSTFYLNGVPFIARPIRVTKSEKLVYYTEKGVREIVEQKTISEPTNLLEEKKLMRSGHVAVASLKDVSESVSS